MAGPGRRLKTIREDLSILRGNFLVLMVTWILWRFAFRMVMPYSSLYIRALGASPTVLGMMTSIYTALFCLSLIPGSYIADAWGRRRIIVLMTYALSLSYLFYVLAPSWELILVGMCLEAFARIYNPALQAITADSIPPEKRGLGYAMIKVIPDLFAIASPLIVVALIRQYGFLPGLRMAYAVVVAAGLTAATIRLLFLKETIRPRPPRKKGILSVYSESLREMVRTIRGASRDLKVVIFVPLLAFPLLNALWTFIPLFAVDHAGITNEEWGLMASIRMGFGLATGLVLGKLADRLGRKKPIVASCLIRSAAFLSLAFTTGFAPVLAVMLALELAIGLSVPSFSALMADLTPREERGRVIGANALVSSLANIPVPFLVGFLYEHVSPYLVLYISSAAFALVALLLAILVREPEEREL